MSIIKIKTLVTSGLNNDVFYFLLIPNYCIFLFSKIKLETKCNEKIKFDKEISQIEIENIFIYQNELSEGYFSKECDCLKNNSFVISISLLTVIIEHINIYVIIYIIKKVFSFPSAIFIAYRAPYHKTNHNM